MMTLKNRYFLFIGSILLVVLVQVVFYAKLSIHHNHVISEPEQLGAFKSRVKSNRKDSSSEKCFSWDEDSDDCWTHHPDFEVTHEDDKSFCLSRIQDQEKAEFYRNVYNLQWKHTKDLACKDAIHANQTNAGFAASVNQIVYGFWAAWNEGLPFQITKHREQFKWMFAPKDCESNDMNCYFLPLSDCPAIVGTEQKYKATKPNGKKDNKLFKWLRLYATRPKQYVRKRVYDFITKDQKLQPPPWNTNCTAMHVRRGDSGFVKFPWRRYAAVQGKIILYMDTCR